MEGVSAGAELGARATHHVAHRHPAPPETEFRPKVRDETGVSSRGHLALTAVTNALAVLLRFSHLLRLPLRVCFGDPSRCGAVMETEFRSARGRTQSASVTL